MKKLYLVGSEGECGEIQGMFTDGCLLLDFWSCNDADWRTEYFNGVMNELGYEVTDPPASLADKLEKQLIKKCKQEWGYDG